MGWSIGSSYREEDELLSYLLLNTESNSRWLTVLNVKVKIKILGGFHFGVGSSSCSVKTSTENDEIQVTVPGIRGLLTLWEPEWRTLRRAARPRWASGHTEGGRVCALLRGGKQSPGRVSGCRLNTDPGPRARLAHWLTSSGLTARSPGPTGEHAGSLPAPSHTPWERDQGVAGTSARLRLALAGELPFMQKSSSIASPAGPEASSP